MYNVYIREFLYSYFETKCKGQFISYDLLAFFGTNKFAHCTLFTQFSKHLIQFPRIKIGLISKIFDTATDFQKLS